MTTDKEYEIGCRNFFDASDRQFAEFLMMICYQRGEKIAAVVADRIKRTIENGKDSTNGVY
jgi:hypothetical protein